MRAKMIDWMIDIFDTYKNSDDYTFYRSVLILDLYLKNNFKNIKKQQQ